MKHRIAIVDDKRQNINSLNEKISASGECDIVFTASNGEDFINKLIQIDKANHPDVVLMDLDMPIMNGIEAIRIASRINDKVKYIMLTVFDDDDNLFEAIKAGANGYLLKGESIRTILDAISEVVVDQGAPMSPAIARKTLRLLSISKVGEPSNVHEIEHPLSDRETGNSQKSSTGNGL